MQQKELDKLYVKFKKRVQEALHESVIPENNFLCIRLDGFQLTKRFLKDSHVNSDFSKALSNAHYQVFCSFRHHLNKEYTSGIVCSFLANDEVSIVLSKDVDNFDRRILKLCTLFSGTLSSSLTKELNIAPDDKSITAFDARPILLKSQNEIAEYIRCRYLVGKRYAYWKMLRLNNYPDVYKSEVKDDIDNAMKIAKKTKQLEKANEIIASYSFFIPEKKEKPKLRSIKINDKDMGSKGSVRYSV